MRSASAKLAIICKQPKLNSFKRLVLISEGKYNRFYKKFNKNTLDFQLTQYITTANIRLIYRLLETIIYTIYQAIDFIGCAIIIGAVSLQQIKQTSSFIC